MEKAAFLIFPIPLLASPPDAVKPPSSGPQPRGPGSILLPKAKGMGEEVRGRLSGHGFEATAPSLFVDIGRADGIIK